MCVCVYMCVCDAFKPIHFYILLVGGLRKYFSLSLFLYYFIHYYYFLYYYFSLYYLLVLFLLLLQIAIANILDAKINFPFL